MNTTGTEVAGPLAFVRQDWERTKADWRALQHFFAAMHAPPALHPVRPRVLQGYHPRLTETHAAHHAWTLQDPHHGGFEGHRENR